MNLVTKTSEFHAHKTLARRYWAALLLPFAYFLCMRLSRRRERIGWLLNYVLPVLALSVIANGGLGGLGPALLAMVAVYSAYEFGYLVNDTVTTKRETSPTLYISRDAHTWFRARLAVAFMARALIGVLFLALLFWLEQPYAKATALGWLALWPVFALYNHWRGRITILIYFVLVSLRFALPVLAAASTEAVVPASVLVLLLLYPLPTTYNAVLHPRHRFGWVKNVVGVEYHFRIAWYAAVTLGALAWAAIAKDARAIVLAAFSLYFLVYPIVLRAIALRLDPQA